MPNALQKHSYQRARWLRIRDYAKG